MNDFSNKRCLLAGVLSIVIGAIAGTIVYVFAPSTDVPLYAVVAGGITVAVGLLAMEWVPNPDAWTGPREKRP